MNNIKCNHTLIGPRIHTFNNKNIKIHWNISLSIFPVSFALLFASSFLHINLIDLGYGIRIHSTWLTGFAILQNGAWNICWFLFRRLFHSFQHLKGIPMKSNKWFKSISRHIHWCTMFCQNNNNNKFFFLSFYCFSLHFGIVPHFICSLTDFNGYCLLLTVFVLLCIFISNCLAKHSEWGTAVLIRTFGSHLILDIHVEQRPQMTLTVFGSWAFIRIYQMDCMDIVIGRKTWKSTITECYMGWLAPKVGNSSECLKFITL